MSKKEDEPLTSSDKALANDEAFMNALYTRVDNAEVDEQPSDELDQRILAAAHKAVAHSPVERRPEAIALSSVKNIKRKKLSTWYVSLASAASLVLVVSLVVNQNDKEIISIDHEFFMEDAMESSAPAATQSEQLFESDIATKYKVEALAPQKQKREKRSAKMYSSANVAITDAKVLVLDPLVKMDSLMNRKPILTYQQYFLFEKQQVQWSLVSEHNDYYVINIFESEIENKSKEENKNKQNFVQYELLKESYHLKKIVAQIDKRQKFLLNEFELIKEK